MYKVSCLLRPDQAFHMARPDPLPMPNISIRPTSMSLVPTQCLKPIAEVWRAASSRIHRKQAKSLTEAAGWLDGESRIGYVRTFVPPDNQSWAIQRIPLRGVAC